MLYPCCIVEKFLFEDYAVDEDDYTTQRCECQRKEKYSYTHYGCGGLGQWGINDIFLSLHGPSTNKLRR
jgi:hypothetical protein